jgi:hypothetical protein
VIIITRIAKAVSLERADSRSAPGWVAKSPSSLVGKELVPGMRKRRVHSWRTSSTNCGGAPLKQMTRLVTNSSEKRWEDCAREVRFWEMTNAVGQRSRTESLTIYFVIAPPGTPRLEQLVTRNSGSRNLGGTALRQRPRRMDAAGRPPVSDMVTIRTWGLFNASP